MLAINASKNWASLDLESLVLHEFGHSLGLHHSTVTRHGQPVMYPTLGNYLRRELTTDDWMSLGAKYHGWTPMTGIAALDIAQGGAGVWAIRSDNVIVQKSGPVWDPRGDWIPVEGNGTSITVSDDGPIVTSLDHTIWRLIGGEWKDMPGEGRDIAISPTSNVLWSVSNTDAGGGNYYLQRWDEANRKWQTSDGVGVRVTVDEEDRVWVVQHNGSVHRRTTEVGYTGSWINLPLPRCLSDIEAGFGAVWGVGCKDYGEGNHEILIWNEQGDIAGTDTHNKFDWVETNGTATRIGVNFTGLPIAAQANGNVFQRTQ